MYVFFIFHYRVDESATKALSILLGGWGRGGGGEVSFFLSFYNCFICYDIHVLWVLYISVEMEIVNTK